MKITLDEFCGHWVKGPTFMTLASRFEYNTLNFATAAGEHSKTFFQNSFSSGGFYGSGTRWKARESKWGRKFTHPLMLDTGTLAKSIQGEGKETNHNGWSAAGKKIFDRGARYYIWTAEASVPQRGKRGKNGRYGKYAAVHNSDPALTNYTVNQYSSKKPVQRQFIGFSKRLDSEIEQFFPMIFKGFPGV